MIPIELEIKNFLAYRDPGPLRFEGIHIASLTGPNGAGKSALLDAITWCLWGKARSNSPDEMIHQGQAEMRVALTFEQDGNRYKVIRQRKAGKRGASLLEFQAWDSAFNAWRSQTDAGMRATQDNIEKLLRLDYDTFVNSAFLIQGRADEFTTKTPNQRKQVLANILGLSRWEGYETRAKEAIQRTRESQGRVEGRLQEVEREIALQSTYELELERAQSEAQAAAKALKTAESQWSDLEQARKDILTLQRSIDDLTRRIQDQQAELDEIEKEHQEALARADRPKLEKELQTVRSRLDELAPLEAQQLEQSLRLNAQAEEMARLNGVNQTLGPQTEPLKKRLATLETTSDPICPTCGQALTEEHRFELLASLQLEIDSRREDFRQNRERIRQLELDNKQLSQALAILAQSLADRSQLEKRAVELDAAIEHATRAGEQAKALQERIDRWRKALEDYRSQRAEQEAKAQQADASLKAAMLTQEELDHLRLEKRLADERVGGARQKLAAVQAFEEQRRQLLENREVLSAERGIYDDLREAFSKRGVPAMIIETVVPELERTANELLRHMTAGRMNVRIETLREIKTGELREALDIIIADELGDRPYEMYSGGEAFRINFAIRIALSKLLARRAGAQLRSLFIDEGFGTQDTQGREHLVSAINSIQDDFDRILIITHIDEMKDNFPAQIEVRKTQEGSQFRLL